ncbi:hypothetical protein [Hymenobacter edaphi]|uniref:Transmembrane protein n=1 Tax=Hymenobacter edaphi TaxID=2211146 RepID=A0A328BB03_9BACT|nr:hypothetical protein [Hymenobacter edaphi]RAK63815.1 hypothetical protein DLM85_19895 [Hymenobacter edaphi]
MLLFICSRPPEAAAQHRPLLPAAGRGHTLEDTVQAVRRLFNGHDAASTSGLAVGVGGLSVIGVGALMPAPFGNPGLRGNFIATGALATGVGAGLSLRRMLRFSPKHRDEVLAAYQQGEPLPPYVRRRLRPEHFQPGR